MPSLPGAAAYADGMDGGGPQEAPRERWSALAVAALGALTIIGLGATGSVPALLVGIVVWAVASTVVGYLLVLRPRLRNLAARRQAEGGAGPG